MRGDSLTAPAAAATDGMSALLQAVSQAESLVRFHRVLATGLRNLNQAAAQHEDMPTLVAEQAQVIQRSLAADLLVLASRLDPALQSAAAQCESLSASARKALMQRLFVPVNEDEMHKTAA
jgi:hypothetical protein